MASRRRPPGARDADQGDDRGEVADPNAGRLRPSIDVPISIAEAEEEAARAEARAEAARARAIRLREQAGASSGTVDVTHAADTDETTVDETRPPRSVRARRSKLRRPGRKAVAAAAAIVLISSLGASGYMVWQDHTIMHKRQLAAEFAAAARQRVTTLMSIDAHHAKEDLQRIIDACTGQLKTQLEATSSLMVKQAEDAKVISKVTVEAVAVESVTDNSAVVLVAAKSDVTNADNTKRPPASWRLSVNIERDGGQLKMSKVDFLQ